MRPDDAHSPPRTATHDHGRLALVRPVSAAFARCELTHLARTPMDVDRARRQHAAYEELLAELGCTLVRLAEEPDLPDSVFVEDTAVVVDELAVLTRPGAESRRGEIASVETALARHRPLVRITAPATLDGGDVLRVGRRLYVGESARSSGEGIAQLRAYLLPHGYTVEGVVMRDCLHLKTAVTEVADGVLLVNPAWLAPGALAHFERVDVDPDEPFAGNALRLGDVVVMPAAFPRTAARLRARGIAVRTVEVDELAKAEGGVTCCSVILAA
jgi:dimethylargininase